MADKDVLAAAVRELAKSSVWVAQVCEAWMLDDLSLYNPDLPVSEHSNRIEAIFINVQSQIGTYIMTAKFKRDKDQKPIQPHVIDTKFISRNDNTHHVEGRMSNFYSWWLS